MNGSSHTPQMIEPASSTDSVIRNWRPHPHRAAVPFFFCPLCAAALAVAECDQRALDRGELGAVPIDGARSEGGGAPANRGMPCVQVPDGVITLSLRVPLSSPDQSGRGWIQ